jgi:hypothetical protein
MGIGVACGDVVALEAQKRGRELSRHRYPGVREAPAQVLQVVAPSGAQTIDRDEGRPLSAGCLRGAGELHR